MAILKAYRGRPVKRIKRMATGLCLYMFAGERGARSERKLVTESEWNRDGVSMVVSPDEMPDVRAWAALAI